MICVGAQGVCQCCDSRCIAGAPSMEIAEQVARSAPSQKYRRLRSSSHALPVAPAEDTQTVSSSDSPTPAVASTAEDDEGKKTKSIHRKRGSAPQALQTVKTEPLEQKETPPYKCDDVDERLFGPRAPVR